MRSPFEPLWVRWSLSAIPRGPAAAVMPAASLALSAVGTGASVLGGITGQSAAAGQQQQQQAWNIYQQQQQAAAMSAQAGWERSLAQQREVIAGQKIMLDARSAGVAEAAATDSIQRGQVAEDVSRLGTKQVEGQQRAALAAQGTDLAGSPTDVLADTAAAGEFNALTIRSNAAREAYGHKLDVYGRSIDAYGHALEGVSAVNDERLAQAKQDNAKPGVVAQTYTPSNFSAGASLLSGASNLAEKWWRFQQNGGLGGGNTSGGGGDYLGYGGTPGPAF